MKRMRLAIIGQGRSGRDIHGRFLQTNIAKEKFEVVAIVELREDRRILAKQEWGCDVYDDYRKLFGRTDIDLVINASYSHMHASISIDLMEHGFHVISEKPITNNLADMDKVMECQKRTGKYFNIFQQSRLAPYFKEIKKVLASGVLGEIQEIDANWSGFSRRWDWQTLQCYCAGNLVNTGPHPLDQVLNLMDAYDIMPNVYSRLASVNVAGDAEDYCKVVIQAPGKPWIQVTISTCDAYSDYNYKIHGSCGTLRATLSTVKYKYFDPKAVPLPVLPREPLIVNGKPAYCKEPIPLPWVEEEINCTGDAFTSAVSAYYNMCYDAIFNGIEPEIQPYQIRQQVAIEEKIYKDNPLPRKYELE
ncbi:MAG TPA: gfo/Idh/MocA family oxidoreductase [Clostridiales bacterium]|nr:gfo/Idh/MocA family oxidoreductase [Clostridiales bacterium]